MSLPIPETMESWQEENAATGNDITKLNCQERFLAKSLHNFPPRNGTVTNRKSTVCVTKLCSRSALFQRRTETGQQLFEQLLCNNRRKQERLLVPDLATEWFRKQKNFLDTVTPAELRQLKLAKKEPKDPNESSESGSCTCRQCGCYETKLQHSVQYLDCCKELRRRRLLLHRQRQQQRQGDPICKCTDPVKWPPKIIAIKKQIKKETMDNSKSNENETEHEKRDERKGDKNRTNDSQLAQDTTKSERTNRVSVCQPKITVCAPETPDKLKKLRFTAGGSSNNTTEACCLHPHRVCTCLRPKRRSSCTCIFQADGQPMGDECLAALRMQSPKPRLRTTYNLREAPPRRLNPACYRRISPEFYNLLRKFEEGMCKRYPMYGMPVRLWNKLIPCCPCERPRPLGPCEPCLGDQQVIATRRKYALREEPEKPVKPKKVPECEGCDKASCPNETCKFKLMKVCSKGDCRRNRCSFVNCSQRERETEEYQLNEMEEEEAGEEGEEDEEEEEEDLTKEEETQTEQQDKSYDQLVCDDSTCRYRQQQRMAYASAPHCCQGQKTITMKDTILGTAISKSICTNQNMLVQKPSCQQQRNMQEPTSRTNTAPAIHPCCATLKQMWRSRSQGTNFNYRHDDGCNAGVKQYKGILGSFAVLCKRAIKPGRHLLYNFGNGYQKSAEHKRKHHNGRAEDNKMEVINPGLFSTQPRPYCWKQPKQRQPEKSNTENAESRPSAQSIVSWQQPIACNQETYSTAKSPPMQAMDYEMPKTETNYTTKAISSRSSSLKPQAEINPQVEQIPHAQSTAENEEEEVEQQESSSTSDSDEAPTVTTPTVQLKTPDSAVTTTTVETTTSAGKSLTKLSRKSYSNCVTNKSSGFSSRRSYKPNSDYAELMRLVARKRPTTTTHKPRNKQQQSVTFAEGSAIKKQAPNRSKSVDTVYKPTPKTTAVVKSDTSNITVIEISKDPSYERELNPAAYRRNYYDGSIKTQTSSEQSNLLSDYSRESQNLMTSSSQRDSTATSFDSRSIQFSNWESYEEDKDPLYDSQSFDSSRIQSANYSQTTYNTTDSRTTSDQTLCSVDHNRNSQSESNDSISLTPKYDTESTNYTEGSRSTTTQDRSLASYDRSDKYSRQYSSRSESTYFTDGSGTDKTQSRSVLFPPDNRIEYATQPRELPVKRVPSGQSMQLEEDSIESERSYNPSLIDESSNANTLTTAVTSAGEEKDFISKVSFNVSQSSSNSYHSRRPIKRIARAAKLSLFSLFRSRPKKSTKTLHKKLSKRSLAKHKKNSVSQIKSSSSLEISLQASSTQTPMQTSSVQTCSVQTPTQANSFQTCSLQTPMQGSSFQTCSLLTSSSMEGELHRDQDKRWTRIEKMVNENEKIKWHPRPAVPPRYDRPVQILEMNTADEDSRRDLSSCRSPSGCDVEFKDNQSEPLSSSSKESSSKQHRIKNPSAIPINAPDSSLDTSCRKHRHKSKGFATPHSSACNLKDQYKPRYADREAKNSFIQTDIPFNYREPVNQSRKAQQELGKMEIVRKRQLIFGNAQNNDNDKRFDIGSEDDIWQCITPERTLQRRRTRLEQPIANQMNYREMNNELMEPPQYLRSGSIPASTAYNVFGNTYNRLPSSRNSFVRQDKGSGLTESFGYPSQSRYPNSSSDGPISKAIEPNCSNDQTCERPLSKMQSNPRHPNSILKNTSKQMNTLMKQTNDVRRVNFVAQNQSRTNLNIIPDGQSNLKYNSKTGEYSANNGASSFRIQPGQRRSTVLRAHSVHDKDEMPMSQNVPHRFSFSNDVVKTTTSRPLTRGMPIAPQKGPSQKGTPQPSLFAIPTTTSRDDVFKTVHNNWTENTDYIRQSNARQSNVRQSNVRQSNRFSTVDRLEQMDLMESGQSVMDLDQRSSSKRSERCVRQRSMPPPVNLVSELEFNTHFLDNGIMPGNEAREYGGANSSKLSTLMTQIAVNKRQAALHLAQESASTPHMQERNRVVELLSMRSVKNIPRVSCSHSPLNMNHEYADYIPKRRICLNKFSEKPLVIAPTHIGLQEQQLYEKCLPLLLYGRKNQNITEE